MSTITITYDGKEEEIDFNENLSFGAVEDIMSKNINLDEIMQGKATVNIPGYNVAITVAAITKAPWELGNVRVFRNLPLKVGRSVVMEATKLYPLQDSVLSWIQAVEGTKS